jgi:hypothetical protein
MAQHRESRGVHRAKGRRVNNELFALWRATFGERAAFNSYDRMFRSNRLVEAYKAREDARKRYAWAVPTDEALDAIAKLSPIVEIGAGTGYWAALLSTRGADVIAYDRAPGHHANHYHGDSPLWFDVKAGGDSKAADHPDRTLFLCWPPYDAGHPTTATWRGAPSRATWKREAAR